MLRLRFDRVYTALGCSSPKNHFIYEFPNLCPRSHLSSVVVSQSPLERMLSADPYPGDNANLDQDRKCKITPHHHLTPDITGSFVHSGVRWGRRLGLELGAWGFAVAQAGSEAMISSRAAERNVAPVVAPLLSCGNHCRRRSWSSSLSTTSGTVKKRKVRGGVQVKCPTTSPAICKSFFLLFFLSSVGRIEIGKGTLVVV